MSLLATIAALVNLGGSLVSLPLWTRVAAIAGNVLFVLAGIVAGDPLVWVAHLALIPLNAALFVGGRRERSA